MEGGVIVRSHCIVPSTTLSEEDPYQELKRLYLLIC